MANKPKIGLDFFPVEVDTFSDIKIRKLIKYQSGKAYIIYEALRCNIYSNGYYLRWDDELPFTISEITGYEEAYIREVINCLFNVGLLNKKMFDAKRILTSKGIQDRYRIICTQLKRKFNISEEYGISSEELNNNSEVTENPSVELPQRKGKEKKENETKEKEMYRAFAHLQISVDEFNMLLNSGYQKNEIDSILDSIENYTKNKNYKNLFLTAKKWLEKDKFSAQNFKQNGRQDSRTFLEKRKQDSLNILLGSGNERSTGT